MSKKKIKITNPPRFGDNVVPEDEVELEETYEEIEEDENDAEIEEEETQEEVQEETPDSFDRKSIVELAQEAIADVKVPPEMEEPGSMEPPYMLIPEQKEPIIQQHVYRVRLAWDKRDTQIYAGPSLEDARAEARKHEGYKIYQDDKGMMIEDPWVKFDTEPKEQTLKEKLKDEGFSRFIHPGAGESIVLTDRPVYRFPGDVHPFTKVTGTFYFYDSQTVKGRAKIVRKYNGEKFKKPTDIFGYIDTKL